MKSPGLSKVTKEKADMQLAEEHDEMVLSSELEGPEF